MQNTVLIMNGLQYLVLLFWDSSLHQFLVSPPTVENCTSTTPTKTIDDLSDMDLLTSDDDEVFEINIVENKSGGNQPDCEDILSEEEWA